MNAIEGNVNHRHRRVKRNSEPTLRETPKVLFKVVVNNYRQNEDDPDKRINDVEESKEKEQNGLPPQPTGYLKVPNYDWF